MTRTATGRRAGPRGGHVRVSALAWVLVLSTTSSAGPSKPAPAGPGDECQSCHASAWEKQRIVHPPVKNGLCFACHVSISETRHLFDLAAEGKQLCAQCHSTRDSQKVLHPPVAEGLCLECHDPHASNERARLRQSTFATCTRCHPSKGLQHQAALTKHGALDPKQNEAVCVACHDAHQSDHEKRLKAWPPEKVCLSCHDQPQQAPDKELMNMKAWLDRHDAGTMRHGPLREGRCPDCHEPHGTNEFRILKGSYPAAPYTPVSSALEDFGLCFRCHDPRLLTEKTLTEKPVSNADPAVDLKWTSLDGGQRLVRGGTTGFRNGDENLHFRHVNKADKGRTCRFCHDVHASENPKHVRTLTPFGNWEFPLNYKKTTTGGACWPGCHVERRYDRNQRQENPR